MSTDTDDPTQVNA